MPPIKLPRWSLRGVHHSCRALPHSSIFGCIPRTRKSTCEPSNGIVRPLLVSSSPEEEPNQPKAKVSKAQRVVSQEAHTQDMKQIYMYVHIHVKHIHMNEAHVLQTSLYWHSVKLQTWFVASWSGRLSTIWLECFAYSTFLLICRPQSVTSRFSLFCSLWNMVPGFLWILSINTLDVSAFRIQRGENAGECSTHHDQILVQKAISSFCVLKNA